MTYYRKNPPSSILTDLFELVLYPFRRTKERRDYRAFYKSREWYSARYDVLKRDGFRCQYCGRRASEGAVLQVDHVRPISKAWHLRLSMNNLKAICSACNYGKGSKS